MVRSDGHAGVVSLPNGARAARAGTASRSLLAVALAVGTTLLCAAALWLSGSSWIAGSSAPGVGMPLRAGGRGELTAALPSALTAIASERIGATERGFWPVRRGNSLSTRGGGISAAFDSAGARLRVGAGTVTISLASLARGGRSVPVEAASPAASANEVLYHLGPVAESYANGPYGLEQSFFLPRRPAGGGGPLRLNLSVGGTLSAAQVGAQVLFRTPAGTTALRYGQLSAQDASGRRLSASMQLRGGALALVIDDRGARYPLRIDPFVQQGPKLVGSEESGKAEFGHSVALSGNGKTALIGGPQDNSGTGAAWLFTRTGSTWEAGPKLTPGGAIGKPQFGFRVALSEDGNTALIGGPVDNERDGAAWVFVRNGSTWEQQEKLTGSGEKGVEPEFGISVALSANGDTALVGGSGDSGRDGSAWVFTRTESTWEQQGSKLTSPSGEEGEAGFGWSVALSENGNTALIGGQADNTYAGAAWVYVRSGSTWEQQGSKLTGSGANGPAHFGYSVSLSGSGNTALIGGLADNEEKGAAWVFARTESTWKQQGSKLTGGGEVGRGLFGFSVALSGAGTTAVIGGASDNTGADGGLSGVGAAWVFARSGSTWEQQGSKLTGEEESGEGRFGLSAALSSDASTALFGGPIDNSRTGAAWAFSNEVQPPTVVTKAATAITGATATLNATINPNGADVSECFFNYGTSISYGKTAQCTALPGAGTKPVSVSAPVTGLSGGTTYHFQIVATSKAGTSEGADETLTTLNPPEYGRCLKLARGVKGSYANSSCTTPATEKSFGYEWAPGPPAKAKFTTKLKAATTVQLETVAPKKLITCKGETGSGEYTGAKTAGNVHLTFTGCEMSGAKCSSSGAGEGEALTKTLEGSLGVEKTSAEGALKNKIAQDLVPTSGDTFMEFTCGSTSVSVTGSVIASVPDDKMQTLALLKYAATTGKQKPEQFEGMAKDVLEASFAEGTPVQTALKATPDETSEEPLEINTVA